jgi:histidine ammonia-lyase
MSATATVAIDGETLTLENLYRLVFANTDCHAEIPADARERMSASRAIIERLADSETAVYGVNTGFGSLATRRISHDEIRDLQLNLVRSHACGVGEPLSADATRAMLALRANALAKGFSGVRPIVADTLVAMLNRDVLPVIPSQGSVGASGDLAPLAHLALAAIGEGEAIFEGRRMPGGEALRAAEIAPLALQAKEGLALLNGTQAMLALVALAVRDAEIAAETADVAASLSLDALRGSPVAFDARIADARPHPGHAIVAGNLERMNRGSEIRESHRSPARDPRVQDPYSLRCAPQVHGAARDATAHVRATVEIELNSATDNPLVFADSGEVLSGGNFHGQPLAMAADHLAVALATLGGICERRIEQMTNPQSSHLPAFLVRHAGLNSGFMILQVAAAALASEMKALAAPHSVDSIPTSANQEDYVSMGMGAARRLGPMIANLQNVLAIELLAAAQGIDLLAPLRPGVGARRAHEMIRSLSKTLHADRSLSPDIAAVAGGVARGEFAALLR